MLYFYLCLSALFALMCAGAAVGRDRNPWGWGAAGAVFGIFAFVAIARLGPNPARPLDPAA